MDFGVPFMTSGLVLLLAGSLVALLRKIPGQIHDWVMSKLTVTLVVRESDEAYDWFQQWFAEHIPSSRRLLVVTKPKQSKDTPFNRDTRPVSLLAIGPGQHYLWYKNRLVSVTQAEQAPSLSTANISESSIKTKSYFIRIYSRNREIANTMMDAVRNYGLPLDGKIDIRIASATSFAYWRLLTRIPRKPLESVILVGNQEAELVADIVRFQASYDWYKSLGIPYHRGYLFYGPPGSGKTSLATALASKFGMNIYTINLASKGLSDGKLYELMSYVGDNAILLLEDVDCAFVQREKADKDNPEGLTFSGVLNAIDGVGSKDGRILIMTTNHVDRLDPALIRPGRVDKRVFIGHAVPTQAAALFARFHPGYNTLATTFGSLIPLDRVSMAAIQGHLLKYRDDPEAAIREVREILV